MTIKSHLLVLGFIVLSFNITYAQDNKCTIHIDDIQQSILKTWRTDIYIWGMWSSIKNGTLWTASNNIGKERSDCYFNFIEFGVGTDLYKDYGILLEGNIGYSYGSLAYTRDLFPSSNVKTHWITLDANISYGESEFYGGVTSSVFLRSSINNSDNYSFEGFYDDCFNRVTLAPYCGFRLRFQYLKFDARIGGQTISFLNANRIAYHNMHKTHVNGLYFELRLGVRLFSTSNPSRPINNLFLNI
ncbi:MAG: hypothetical protein MJZ51_02930 [Bacteroidales bacterium]|nr:hypothetical protein [Bacteroidales bacterium]